MDALFESIKITQPAHKVINYAKKFFPNIPNDEWTLEVIYHIDGSPQAALYHTYDDYKRLEIIYPMYNEETKNEELQVFYDDKIVPMYAEHCPHFSWTNIDDDWTVPQSDNSVDCKVCFSKVLEPDGTPTFWKNQTPEERETTKMIFGILAENHFFDTGCDDEKA
jgi:hypothetical protein